MSSNTNNAACAVYGGCEHLHKALPFTGSEVWLLIVIGILLIASGFLIRWAAKEDNE